MAVPLIDLIHSGCPVLATGHPLFVTFRLVRRVNVAAWKESDAANEWAALANDLRIPTLTMLIPFPAANVGQPVESGAWGQMGTLLESDTHGAARWRWLYLRHTRVERATLATECKSERVSIGPVFAPTTEFIARWSCLLDSMGSREYHRAWVALSMQGGYLYESLTPNTGFDSLLTTCATHYGGGTVSSECLALIQRAEAVTVPEGLHPHIGYYMGPMAAYSKDYYSPWL